MRGRVASMILTSSSSWTAPIIRHGSTWASQQPSAFHTLPMPATLRWSSRASPSGRVGSSPRTRARNEREVELGGQHVGAERGEALIEARAPFGHELEQRAVELDHLVSGSAEHDPRTALRAAPPSPGPVHPPRPRHSQVRVQNEAALEAQEQMLAVRVDTLDGSPGQPLGPAVESVPGVGSADLLRDVALEDGADAVGRPGDRVALRH